MNQLSNTTTNNGQTGSIPNNSNIQQSPLWYAGNSNPYGAVYNHVAVAAASVQQQQQVLLAMNQFPPPVVQQATPSGTGGQPDLEELRKRARVHVNEVSTPEAHISYCPAVSLWLTYGFLLYNFCGTGYSLDTIAQKARLSEGFGKSSTNCCRRVRSSDVCAGL